ncbi:MAG: glycosyltransferase [Trichocoleus desertorum ATA4-8-CV12]|jgi:hypothetical protein|nr:glycosyltransferase [Trichocoleus desertorum ATA4-8-CV12]
MPGKLPPTYFYIPEADWPAEMPKHASTYWQWQCSQVGSRGIYNWTLQTYLQLRDAGFPCELVGTLPTVGILVAHRDSLPDELRPGPQSLIVCIQGDKARHPYAQLHLAQNSQEEMLVRGIKLWQSYYIPFWPQPGLIPRDSSGGDRFENIAFFGRERELAAELKTSMWQEQLSQLGLQWQIVSRDRWHDYSQVDAILAVRNFGKQSDYQWKPASKLVNAWHAGVPAILSRESAYQAERQTELDYIEVNSMAEILAALKKLRDHKELRAAMVENGRLRAEAIKPTKLAEKWSDFLKDVAVPAYERWCGDPSWQRQTFLTQRYLAVETKDLRHQARIMRSRISGPIKTVLGRSK